MAEAVGHAGVDSRTKPWEQGDGSAIPCDEEPEREVSYSNCNLVAYYIQSERVGPATNGGAPQARRG